jgi:hypothetical protein
MKKVVLSLSLLGAMMIPADAAPPAAPKSVVHVINVRFKADASKAAIDDAIAAIGKMNYAGLKNVWLKPIKVQGGDSKFTHCLVMEFESEEALNKYSGSEAQKEWYKKWLAVRDLSNTHDVTN